MQKKILIVESDAEVVDALERRLRARGYTPDTVEDADRAVDAFERARPELVVVSLTLKDADGVTVCRAIRQRPLGALVPILFLGTGRETINSVPDAIAAGADHFFIKPDGIGELLAKVITYIGPGQDPTPNDATPPSTAGLFTSLEAEEDAPQEWAELDGLLRADAIVDAPSSVPDDETEDDTEAMPTSPVLEPDRVEPPSAPPPDSLFGARNAPQSAVEQVTADPGATTERLAGGPEFASPPTGMPDPPASLSPSPGDGYQRPRQPPRDEAAEWATLLQPGRPVELAKRGMGELLAAAAKVKLTGRIELASSGVLRRVFLDLGRPVYADSSAPSEDLASHLAAEGRVASSALLRARERAAQLGASPEEVLIEAGFIEPVEVYRALREHVLERILSLFGLERGEGVVIRGGPRPLDPVDLGQHPGRLVLDGVRRKYGRLRLYRSFGTSSAVARPRPGRSTPPELALRPDEEAVWKSCDGRRTVIEIARVARVGEVDALAILYGLSALDLVEAPSGRRPALLPALAQDTLARAAAPRTADDLPGFADLVHAKLSDARVADYFQVLGIGRGATDAEVRAAFESIRRRFDPHRVRRDGPLWAPVSEIASIVEDAYQMLSRTRLRARYERALS